MKKVVDNCFNTCIIVDTENTHRNLNMRNEIIGHVNECLERAKELFGFMDHVYINFRNTGTTAGWASARRLGYGEHEYSLTFNTQLLSDEHKDALITDTIPHEIAHLVCYAFPHLGKNHDKGWKRVCRMLGGNGERCHSLQLNRARRTRKAVYDIAGREVKIGMTVHKRIQEGRGYSIVPDNSTRRIRITPSHFTGKVVMVT